MSETYKPVDFETLRVGDVVHVHWEYGGMSELFLNQEIREVSISTVLAGNWTFRRPACKFYLVSKAKNPLPIKLGAAVQHLDGWQFIRIGEDSWCAIDPRNGLSSIRWRDEEVSCEDWEEF